MISNELVVIFLLSVAIFIQYTYYNVTIENYGEVDLLLEKIKRNLVLVDPRIAKLKFYSASKSYTMNKQKIYLCLRDKKGKEYDYNFLIYVAIHECAHALSSVYDNNHTSKEFLDTFSKLREKAYKIGVWNKEGVILDDYCNYHKHKN